MEYKVRVLKSESLKEMSVVFVCITRKKQEDKIHVGEKNLPKDVTMVRGIVKGPGACARCRLGALVCSREMYLFE